MGRVIPGQDSDKTLENAFANPTAQQDEAPIPLRGDAPRKARRRDSGKLHRMRHGILSREALDALVQVGEDRRTLRRLERQYRLALRPAGPFGDLFFDRFWSSYLKLILVSRLETQLFAGSRWTRANQFLWR